MNDTRKVNIIHSRIGLPLSAINNVGSKRRVAAYARVSTDSQEQLSSYEAQVEFYTRHIRGNPEWEFVAVYTDEGISGTNMKKRDGFKRMVADALDGKIDLILTKSISRFARNTVDSLTTVRKLKEKGVEIYFEKENIYTLDSKGEVMITIMSSLAQEESRSISENVTWGKRKSMEDGKVSLAYKRFLGYEKGPDGLPQIVEAEAQIIRNIYGMFLEGKTVRTIASSLMERNILTPGGKQEWRVSTVMSILSNEKYKGAALLQKTYTVDFLSKTSKKNEGEVPQYYIENSHPAIIEPETFDLVQSEIAKRRPYRRQLNNSSPFTAKIVCSSCGGYYGSKVWHSTDSHRKHIWRCNKKYDGSIPCGTPHITESELMQAFVSVFNQLLSDKDIYLSEIEELLPVLADTTVLEKKLATTQRDYDAALGQLRRYVETNARQVQDQSEYAQQYRTMEESCKTLEEQLNKLEANILEQAARKEKIVRFLEELRHAGDIITEFDSALWCATVEMVTVHKNKALMFRFRDGREVSFGRLYQ